jgi:hypothetical protein
MIICPRRSRRFSRSTRNCRPVREIAATDLGGGEVFLSVYQMMCSDLRVVQLIPPMSVTRISRNPSCSYFVSCISRPLSKPGGILVFLTGRREIEEVCAKLRRKFSKLGTLVTGSANDKSAADAAKESSGAGAGKGVAPRKPMSKSESLLANEEETEHKQRRTADDDDASKNGTKRQAAAAGKGKSNASAAAPAGGDEKSKAASSSSSVVSMDSFGGGADAMEEEESAMFDIDSHTRAREVWKNRDTQLHLQQYAFYLKCIKH